MDYGNNLRGQAEKGGLTVRDENGQFLYPGFVPGYIRPLFCEGKGPFRWAALSRRPAGHSAHRPRPARNLPRQQDAGPLD